VAIRRRRSKRAPGKLKELPKKKIVALDWNPVTGSLEDHDPSKGDTFFPLENSGPRLFRDNNKKKDTQKDEAETECARQEKIVQRYIG